MTRARDDLLSRWSRRKQAARHRPPAESETRAPEATPSDPDKSDAELLDELGLPDPDTLAPGDDIRAFMQDAVPHRLRNRALRRLWRANPVLANLDGLVDYGEDYTDAARVVDNLVTAYRAGRGYLPDANEAVPQDTEDHARGDAAPDSVAPDTTVASPDSTPPEAAAAETEPGGSEDAPAMEEAPRRVPRMRFQVVDS